MADITLTAHVREAKGKNQVDKLRADGQLPAVIYHKDAENINLQVSALEFVRVYEAAGTSTLIDLDIDGKKQTALIKEVQRHPFRDQVLHIDFVAVRMDEAIKVVVPVVLQNRDVIRVQPSILLQVLSEIEIETLPANIPQFASVDVENMQYGESLYVKDLDIAKDDKITILTDREEVLCTLELPTENTEEEETEAAEAADVPEVGKENQGEE